MSVLTDHPSLGWLALALGLAVAEVATVDLIFLMLVGGALGAAVAAGLGVSLVGQVVTAVLVALLLLGLVRPVLLRRVRTGDVTLTGTSALVGRDALVIETVSAEGGRIKLSGEVWSARVRPTGTGTALTNAVPPGRTVRVLAIDGATAIVAPHDSLTATAPEMRLS